MKYNNYIVSIILTILAVSFSSSTYSAPKKGELVKKNRKIPPTTMGVVNAKKCPELKEGNGAGDLVGGMCLYPLPTGGCSELDDSCSVTQDLPPQCRCPQSKGFNGGSGGTNIPQVQTIN